MSAWISESFDALLTTHALAHEAIEDILPLSPMQEGLLFHSLYERSEAYFEQSAYRLAGRIDPGLFEEAWNRLLERHPNLRVVFWQQDVPRPAQVVLRERRVEFLSEDWRAMDPHARRARLSAFRARERSRGFDLTRDPLVRVALFRVDEESFDAVWASPHILLDGWSAGVLLGELLAIYAALAAARRPELPEPVPYRRYLQWLERQDREASGRFWEAYLAGHDETTSVPSDRRRAEGEPLPTDLDPVEPRPGRDAPVAGARGTLPGDAEHGRPNAMGNPARAGTRNATTSCLARRFRAGPKRCLASNRW